MCPAAGFVLVPLNIRLAPSELVAIVRAARPTVLSVDRDPGALADEVERVLSFDEWDAASSKPSPAVASAPR